MSFAPVALFVYNRPWHTRQAVEALRANPLAAETPLYVFSDAHREAAAKQAVEEVRAYIRTITGFHSITIIERNENYGLARAIITGVGQLCEQYGRVIVLEDDLATSRYFLEYMNAALDKYEQEQRVMQIAGYMFPAQMNINEDAVLLPFTSSWGWGTWQRAWRYFDAEAQGFEQLKANSELRRAFDLGGRYGYFRMLESQRRGETDSWAIRWYLSVFLRQGLTLYPRKSLVRNLGFDGSGVNCVASSIAEASIEAEFRVQVMPERIEVTSAYEAVLESIPRPRLNLKTLMNRFWKLIRTAWYEKTR